MTQFEVPIAFLVFNRPDTTARVFEEIRRIKPLKLLVVADGPRADRPGEAEKCAAVRSIVEQVDWPCEVLKNYAETNMGCKRRVSSGLDWVFELEEEAIILEDDCMPHPTFFSFCKDLLEKYREDERVAMISGDNFQFGHRRTLYSYYFSRYPHIWGWASWRRAWRLYDVKMSLWPEIMTDGWLQDIFPRKKIAHFWKDNFSCTYDGKIDTWDHQLTFAIAVNGGLCIVPDRNLVSNIGFGADATHTKQGSRFAEVPVETMKFPLCHPPFLIRDVTADERTENEQYSTPSLLIKILRKLRSLLNAL